MKFITKLFIFSLWFCFSLVQAQEIPSYSIIPTDELQTYLKKEVLTLLKTKDKTTDAELAAFFRKKFSERFFYDWHTVDEQFSTYNQLYGNQGLHIERANDHLSKYADSTKWKLPFNYLDGAPVNAYALRHLARQHKMLDIAYLYFYENKNPKYIHYFTNQMQSLNAALAKNDFEKIEDGNGVYEVFRSGYRILNWLSIHNLFLGQETYTDDDQLYTIATLLQHGAHLYQNNERFRPGNHQTRGMSALAMLSILFRDFEDADLWYARAMTRLGEHLDKEINEDGFQFERSVHYHISDISNYFYVYQLAQISAIEVDEAWKERLRALFETLAKIAYPDKTAPVLQDDTATPWAEKNQISRTMTLGYLLFNDPEFGYFAENKVEDKLYWFLQQKQLEMLESIDRKKPNHGSLHLPQTGYYIMREGWNQGDKMMIISAGLDAEKPDHQHGDMLGVQAIANGNIILPNYQVRYSLKDYDLFKNSMVKNVALVDDELQGKKWKGNKGNSGFGKFMELPQPKVIAWKSDSRLDLFVGTHNGFSNKNVDYSRQVIYVKDDFWIVKDNFYSNAKHKYKQIWQGHYTDEHGSRLLRSSFSDGTGCDIIQLDVPDRVIQSGKRGKEWSILEKEGQTNFSFITVIYPFSKYESRIDENEENPMVGNWKVNDPSLEFEGIISLSQKQEALLFEVKRIKLEEVMIHFSDETDIFICWEKGARKIQSLGTKAMVVTISDLKNNNLIYTEIIHPGGHFNF